MRLLALIRAMLSLRLLSALAALLILLIVWIALRPPLKEEQLRTLDPLG